MTTNSGAELKAAIERFQRLFSEQDDIADALKDLKTELKPKLADMGFDLKDVIAAAKTVHKDKVLEKVEKAKRELDVLIKAGLIGDEFNGALD